MSDYGFKTLKRGSESRVDTAINAKYPMMGFDLSHRPSAYRTIHISDAKTNPFASSSTPGYSSPSLPSVGSLTSIYYGFNDPQGNFHPILGGSNKTSGYVRELIYQYEHGYDFRPAGYGIITGTINRRTRTNAIGTPVSGNYYFNGSLSNGNWNKITAFNTTEESGTTQNLFPYMNGMKADTGESLNSHLFTYALRDAPSTSNPNAAVKEAMWRLSIYHFTNFVQGDNVYYPYDFEIDEKYVKIYRTYYWSEIYGQIYFDHTFYDSGYNWRYQMQDYLRVKQVEQTAGSEIDITIMLFPYKMEDIR